jgi:hypothetical protein
MYDASAQRFHLSQRPREIIYREVRQGEGIPGATSARVEPNPRNGGPRLPALTLSFAAALQGSAEQSAPKAQRTLGFVGRELDQGQREPLHAHNITPGGEEASTLGARTEGGVAAGVSALPMQSVRPPSQSRWPEWSGRRAASPEAWVTTKPISARRSGRASSVRRSSRPWRSPLADPAGRDRGRQESDGHDEDRSRGDAGRRDRRNSWARSRHLGACGLAASLGGEPASAACTARGSCFLLLSRGFWSASAPA